MQITGFSIVCSTVCLSKKTSKLCVTGLSEGNLSVSGGSLRKGSVTRKVFSFDDVIVLHNDFTHDIHILCWMWATFQLVLWHKIIHNLNIQELIYRDSTWWRHDLETLSAFLVIGVRNPSVVSGFPSPRTNNGIIIFFVVNNLLNKRASCLWVEMIWRSCHVSVMGLWVWGLSMQSALIA